MIDEESMQKIGDDIEESKKDKINHKIIPSAPKSDYSTPTQQPATYQIGISILVNSTFYSLKISVIHFRQV